MKKLLLVIILALLITSCSSQSNEDLVQTSVAATMIARDVTETMSQPTNTTQPTNTPRPTSTPAPTKTPTSTKTATIVSTDMIAKNYVAFDEDNEVVVEIARILIAPKESVPQDFSTGSFADKSTLVEFIFRITNNSDQVISSNFYTTIASVNGEQIAFENYKWDGSFLDNLDSDILPGSTVIGGYWTGVKRSTWDSVEKIVISIPHFYGPGYSSVTKDFLFTIDVVDWTFEEMPEELK